MATDLCSQARDLLPAYSIGATTSEETHFVESQMADCPDLAHELRDYQMLSEGLLRHVPQFAPPPRLFENLMAATMPSTATNATPYPSVVKRPSPTIEQAITPRRKVQADTSGRVSLRTSLGYGLVAALALALFGSNVYWLTQYNQLQDDRKELYGRFAWLEEELQAQNISFDTMSAPDTRWARMGSPTETTETPFQLDDPYAWMIWSASRESGVLLAQNFPNMEANKVYQLWGHDTDSDVSLAIFRTDEQGEALVQITGSAWGFERFWITSEPEGGSASPSGDPFIRVRLN